MENLRQVREVADRYGLRVLFDSARFAENAYFIKTREEGYADRTIKEIVREMFSLADGMTMSAKKDAIVNMGGFIATRHEDWAEGARRYSVPFEGYLTYGGMNGRDMEALAVGLDENTEFDNLNTRIHQVQYLASKLDRMTASPTSARRRPCHIRGCLTDSVESTQRRIPGADTDC